MAYQETLFRAMVQDVHDEEFEVHRVHDERREAEREALEAIAAAEAHEILCYERLRRVGRGYLWRRRIGIVLPVAEDAKFLVDEHHRFHKHTIVMENIIRGDMRHYFALLSQISFPHQAQSMVQDIEMYLWTTDCLPHVEKHCREQLEMEWHQELLRTLYEPFLVERAQVALIPKAVSEGRVAAAKSIQRAYRNHCNIVWFAENMKDAMTLAKEKRLLLHAERRLLQDRESNERDAIVADWVDTDWAAMRRNVFESARQWNAATAINKVARGWYVRNVIIPPLLVLHLKRRLKSLRQRSNSPTTARENAKIRPKT
ncbi:Hypothetical protein, putative [Bodo saltans]|uniref:Uncharacterized protein n=1 Tax=Bodo saltans TaxID=75058 RepID=A0A0S4IHI6_BODSA|nr:Hypothetical protein, putative [Bodo saltans]|eukprot:CUE65254.1 Hypothetical protein, putative [Bodo saltans]